MGSALVRLPQTVWDFGAYHTAERGSPILLVADVVNAPGESRYSVLRRAGAADGYQVTTGKTLVLTKCRFNATIASAAWLILSGTADAGDSQIAAPAGAKSENSRADGVSGALNVLNANDPVEFDLYAEVAAGRYPAIRLMTANGTLNVLIVGIEI